MRFKLLQLNEDFFDDLSVAFFCSNNDVSKKWIPVAIKKGVTVIDNSSQFRLDANVPLIIPEINGNLLHSKKHTLIANPNCSTAILCMILYPLTKLNVIKRVDVSTYQAVSGAGKAGLDELENQMNEYVLDSSQPLTCSTFKSPILGNCFSHNSKMDPDTGYNEEEQKIIFETHKILDNNFEISATCVRIPVMRAHTDTVKIVFASSVSENDIRKTLESFPGVKLLDDRETNSFPEPLIASGKNDIYVGRIRKDMFDKDNTTYHMMICGDQLLKGAAWNAFQIFKLIEK
jgi:aspartate-semialdehyde dehydrogenase